MEQHHIGEPLRIAVRTRSLTGCTSGAVRVRSRARPAGAPSDDDGAEMGGTAMWEPSERYPDPAVEILDPSFAKYRLTLPPSSGSPPASAGARGRSGSATAAICCGATSRTTASCAGTRRPARSASSASPRTTPTATPATARAGSSPASTTRAASRAPSTTARITVLLDRFDGKPLNSPNDVVVKSDGSIWFTDPPFGILGNYEGHVATPELPTNVYRVDGKTGKATVVAGDINRPNGLCFSPDENEALHRRIAAPRRADPRLRRGRRRHQARQRPDLHRLPARRHARRLPLRRRRQSLVRLGHGRRSSTASRSSRPTGKPIGHIALPERCANLCFGGVKRNRLFMAASQSLYALYVNTQGAPGG